MLKKTSEVKIDTEEASKKASSTALGIICPHCGHLVSIKIEDLDNPYICLNCHKSFQPSQRVER